MQHRKGLLLGLSLAALVGTLALFGPMACSSDLPGASARVITYRSELIGGDRAAGEIGDFIIENEKVRFVIQKSGASRGFGVFGGSILDADLRRPTEHTPGGDGVGFDQFAEMFPALFVQAAAIDEVKVLSDGTDGGPARIEASGNGGDFFEMLAVFNRVITGSHASFLTSLSTPQLRYAQIYELEPGKQYLTLRFRVTNTSSQTLTFPGADKGILESAGLPTEGFTVPVGDVALFGATSRLFIPGVGFDLRGGLDEAYERGADFPAFPGILADFVASKGEHTSYGIVARPSARNFALSKKEAYASAGVPITDSTMLVPFTTSGAIGIFYENAPDALEPGATFEAVRYFVVGTGDVGSIADVVHDLRGGAVGTLGALVVDSETGVPADGASVVVYTRSGDVRKPYSQYDVKSGGYVTGTLPPGSYSLRVAGDGRATTAPVDFEVAASQTTSLRVEAEAAARIFVHVRGENGLPLPAKTTAVGRYDASHAGARPETFLYDLAVGDELRSTDMVKDDPSDPETRRFIESIAFTDEGTAELLVRPGTYVVVSSRGPEYDIGQTQVTVGPQDSATITQVLRRVVDTTGWMAADPHVHSRESTDSSMTLDERVRSLAAEGVEIPVATDHNVVTDYGPFVARNGLSEWLHPLVGVEMTTLESGHFNGYPLDYDAGRSSHGSFPWSGLPPDEIFGRLRDLGTLGGQTIVQVNHPRDEVLGYYNQYARHALTHERTTSEGFDSFLEPKGPAFLTGGKTTYSFGYDAIELVNGKLYAEIRHFRVPDELPPGELPAVIPPAGSILTDETGEVAFPGVVDDWFNLLNAGFTYVGIGSGDSHSAFDEAGQFRTMIYMGDDRPAAVTDQDVVDGLRSRRVVATNGPLVDFYVNQPEQGAMGQTIVDGDGTVSVTVSLTSAPWLSVGRLNIYRNGQIARVLDVDDGRDLTASPLRETFDLQLDEDEAGAFKDSWFVIEAIGYRSMFPVVRPLEIPPLMLIDAVSSLAGPLGLGQDEFGALRPPDVFPVTAYAITNPVWVKRGDGPFVPPGLVSAKAQSDPANDPKLQAGVHGTSSAEASRRKVKREERPGDRHDRKRGWSPIFDRAAGNIFDTRNALARYGLPHGH